MYLRLPNPDKRKTSRFSIYDTSIPYNRSGRMIASDPEEKAKQEQRRKDYNQRLDYIRAGRTEEDRQRRQIEVRRYLQRTYANK